MDEKEKAIIELTRKLHKAAENLNEHAEEGTFALDQFSIIETSVAKLSRLLVLK